MLLGNVFDPEKKNAAIKEPVILAIAGALETHIDYKAVDNKSTSTFSLLFLIFLLIF